MSILLEHAILSSDNYLFTTRMLIFVVNLENFHCIPPNLERLLKGVLEVWS
jgi:hypothetical protein